MAAKKCVVLDVPHGRNNRAWLRYDPGATTTRFQEHEVAEGMVYRLHARFKHVPSVDAYLVEDKRYTKRAGIVDDIIAPYGFDNGFMLSPHLNGNSVNGVESFIHPQAGALSQRAQHTIHPRMVRAIGLRDRGKKRCGYSILAGRCSALLVEMCGMNASNLAAYQANVGTIEHALFQGILATLGIGADAGPTTPARRFGFTLIHHDLDDGHIYQESADEMGDSSGTIETTQDTYKHIASKLEQIR